MPFAAPLSPTVTEMLSTGAGAGALVTVWTAASLVPMCSPTAVSAAMAAAATNTPTRSNRSIVPPLTGPTTGQRRSRRTGRDPTDDVGGVGPQARSGFRAGPGAVHLGRSGVPAPGSGAGRGPGGRRPNSLSRARTTPVRRLSVQPAPPGAHDGRAAAPEPRRHGRMGETDVAVVGAGPYGLAATAHLRRAGVETRTLGDPMSFWRGMPIGMLLRSNWTATCIAEFQGPLSLDSYCQQTGERFGRPVPLERFLAYGTWVQQQAVPDVDRRRVVRLDRRGGGGAPGPGGGGAPGA